MSAHPDRSGKDWCTWGKLLQGFPFQFALDNPGKVQLLPGDLSKGPPGTPELLWKLFPARCLIFSSFSTQITPKHFFFPSSQGRSSFALFFTDSFWRGEKTL